MAGEAAVDDSNQRRLARLKADWATAFGWPISFFYFSPHFFPYQSTIQSPPPNGRDALQLTRREQPRFLNWKQKARVETFAASHWSSAVHAI
jgi:hypothetical protein